MAASKQVKIPQKARNRKRKVAVLAANGQTPQQIAPQVGVTARRVQQLLGEEDVIAMRRTFESRIHEREVDAHEALMGCLERKLETEDWATAAKLIEDRLTHGEQSRAKTGAAAGAAQSALGVGELRLEEFFAIARGVRIASQG